MSKKFDRTKEYAFEMAGIILAPIAAIKVTQEFCQNLSNLILIGKIERFLRVQDSDFDEWLKASCDFQSGSEKYANTVKQLLYVINSINEENKLDVYANLMRAYKLNFLSRDNFLRLSNILSTTYYGDILFMKDRKNWDIIEDVAIDSLLPVEAVNLLNYGLGQDLSIGRPFVNGRRFSITKLGIEMVRCGLDFDNYDSYKDTDSMKICD